MNRRSMLKTAVAGVAAMCGIKAAKAGPTITFKNSFEGQVTSIGWSGSRRNDARFITMPVYDEADLQAVDFDNARFAYHEYDGPPVQQSDGSWRRKTRCVGYTQNGILHRIPDGMI